MKKANTSSVSLMTEGPIGRILLSFAIPLFWGNLFQQLYNIADTMIVGNMLGSNALAAVSSSGNIIFLLVGFFAGIGMGSGVVTARFFGAGDKVRLKRAMHTTVAFGLVCGVILTAVALPLAPAILRLIGTPENVLPQSLIYFRVYFLGSLGFVMFNFLMGLLQSLGDSHHPVIFLAISAGVNVVLDVLFIGPFHLGIGGAAFATILSQGLSAVLCLRQLMKNPPEYRIYLREIRLDRVMVRQIISNGLPAGVQNSIISVANVFVQSNVNAFGASAMAGNGSYVKVEGFAFIPVMCFSSAITTFVGQNIGAGKKDRAFRGALDGTLYAMIVAEVLGILAFTLAPYYLPLFGCDAEAVAVGTQQAHIVPPFYCVLTASHCLAAVMRGAGHSFIPMFTMAIVWCALRVAYISVAVRIVPKITTVFWAYPITWVISTVILLFFFLRRKWLNGPRM